MRALRGVAAFPAGRMGARPRWRRDMETRPPSQLRRVRKDWGPGWGEQATPLPVGLPKPQLTPASSSPQNRPSVITCASASTRNCNLSHCPIAHSGCVAAGPASYRRAPSCKSPCVWGGRQLGGGLGFLVG